MILNSYISNLLYWEPSHRRSPIKWLKENLLLSFILPYSMLLTSFGELTWIEFQVGTRWIHSYSFSSNTSARSVLYSWLLSMLKPESNREFRRPPLTINNISIHQLSTPVSAFLNSESKKIASILFVETLICCAKLDIGLIIAAPSRFLFSFWCWFPRTPEHAKIEITDDAECECA